MNASAKPHQCFNLSGQVPKIVKDDETVIMQTARNASDDDENDDSKRRSISPTIMNDSGKPQTRLLGFTQAKNTMLQKLAIP